MRQETAIEPGREWATARAVQRFMQLLCPAIDILNCSARYRQLQELGRDCCDFVPHGGL